jgi:hypothetical protein
LHFICRSRGVLAIIREFSNDVVFNLKLEMHMTNMSPKVDELREMDHRDEGFRSIVNKNFPTQRTRKPRSNLGDVINERGR